MQVIHKISASNQDTILNLPVVVCFGLNDVARRAEGLDLYINSLREIFERLKLRGQRLFL